MWVEFGKRWSKKQIRHKTKRIWELFWEKFFGLDFFDVCGFFFSYFKLSIYFSNISHFVFQISFLLQRSLDVLFGRRQWTYFWKMRGKMRKEAKNEEVKACLILHFARLSIFFSRKFFPELWRLPRIIHGKFRRIPSVFPCTIIFLDFFYAYHPP